MPPAHQPGLRAWFHSPVGPRAASFPFLNEGKCKCAASCILCASFAAVVPRHARACRWVSSGLDPWLVRGVQLATPSRLCSIVSNSSDGSSSNSSIAACSTAQQAWRLRVFVTDTELAAGTSPPAGSECTHGEVEALPGEVVLLDCGRYLQGGQPCKC